MAFFEGSSRSRRGGRNRDGSWRVTCTTCHQYISDSPQPLGPTQCELCTRALNGELMTAEQIEQYNRSKLGMRDVSLLRIDDAPVVGGKKFSLATMGGTVLRAMGFAQPSPRELESVKTAQQKQRGRLFANVDLEQEPIGGMEEIDAALSRDKE